MELKLEVVITDTQTTIQLNHNQDRITITDTETNEVKVEQPSVYFLVQDQTIVHIGQATKKMKYDGTEFNKIIAIYPSWEVELPYLEQIFIAEALENGVLLQDVAKEESKIPKSQVKTITEYKDEILLILEKFGYPLHVKAPKPEVKVAKKSAKARHRWTKEVSQIEFFVDTRESKATVMWQKRNEMLLKAGAKMMPVAPLNKDGSVGFSAKMGDKLRADYADKFKNFVTTEDMILKSVNEVGLFLYYAGTNSWLELLDTGGKSIDAWTRVD
ncbi:hypothetical protein ACWOFR_16425 [Carnobacterium gallinarum]|uniref:hypothetical protein n=1 Tax=Carnobacterium gallinarum TaxID=2749 RepID=UPI000551FF95|nr:hypothetical protein [Carnobacterium gallinarum]